MTNIQLKERIKKDLVDAMKSHDDKRRDTIRLLLAAIKQREVDERIVLDDTQIASVIHKMIKQRQDSASQFQKAGRTDLEDQENFEISVIEPYLPPAIDETTLETMITEAINAVQASSMLDMGKVMAHIKPLLEGRADMAMVSAKIKQRLGSSSHLK
jgi:uncharacterized protein